eukprot:scaffold218869_cov36-Tisochrysis_lutea.AAC.1
MAPSEDAVRSACSSLLSGLDEDVMEYIVEMFINGEDTGGELLDALAEFLLSYEYCESESAAKAKAQQLIAAILPSTDSVVGENAEVSEATRMPTDSSAPKLLVESINLAEVGGELFKQPEEYELGGRLVGIDEAMEDRKKRKAAREEERRATRRMYDKVAAQRAKEDELLEAARVQAVRLRRERGAYLGSVEAKPFSMPNPGGGPDLLENATFTLQRGRRYGLIGRNGTGKSTLLRSLASRQLGDIPAALTIHYVSQEVKLDEEAMKRTPLEVSTS